MLYFQKKIIHYLTANSRHGTHSPFVYALAEEVIYNKNIVRGKSLIEDIIDYYGTKGKDSSFFLVTDFDTHSVADILKLQHEYFMIFVRDIYKGKGQVLWDDMRRDPEFIVLIDLFEVGIVCKRKEQPKENFKLRFPYWFY